MAKVCLAPLTSTSCRLKPKTGLHGLARACVLNVMLHWAPLFFQHRPDTQYSAGPREMPVSGFQAAAFLFYFVERQC